MDSIKGAFECRWCLSEIVDPVFLPCEESVCEKHTQDLREAKWKCVLCDGVHRLTSRERFPENKTLSRILELNMAKLDFGPNHKKAKEQVNKLDDKNKQLKQMVSEPDDYVANYAQKYIHQVDLAREEIIKIIDDACDRMKEEINKFKSSCRARITLEINDLIELQKSVETKIKTWKEKLNELAVNEPLWQDITKEAESAESKVDSKLFKNAFEPPLVMRHVTDSVKKDAWLELSKSLRIPAMNISDMRDKKSVLVPKVSQIAKAESWDRIYSKNLLEDFTLNSFPFYVGVKFNVLDGKMWLGAHLFSRSNHEKQTVELSWKINVFGKHYQLIRQKDVHDVFYKAIGWGFDHLICLNDIMAHPSYDPEEDMVRVEVEIDEKSVQVKDKVATI